jgi:hypothetical protein
LLELSTLLPARSFSFRQWLFAGLRAGRRDDLTDEVAALSRGWNLGAQGAEDSQHESDVIPRAPFAHEQREIEFTK